MWFRYEADVMFCKVYKEHLQINDPSSNDIELPQCCNCSCWYVPWYQQRHNNKSFLYFSKYGLQSKMFQLARLTESRKIVSVGVSFYEKILDLNISLYLSLSIHHAYWIGISEIMFGRCVYWLLVSYSLKHIYHFGRVWKTSSKDKAAC